jgi:hypothetical protein
MKRADFLLPDWVRTHEIELDWCGLLDVRHARIAIGFCGAAEFRDVP